MFSSFKLPSFRARSKSLSSSAPAAGNEGGESVIGRPPKTPLGSPKQKKNHRRRPSDVGCPSIASLRPGSAAGRSDQLSPGDRVRSVNGISTARMRSDEVSSLLDNVIGDAATLELEYSLPEYSSQGSLCVQTKVTTITLERVDGSLGITLRGGAPPGDSQAPSPTPGATGKPLVVTHVRPGGPAHRSGRIKIGDRLLQVDHHSLANKTLLDAHQLLKQHTSSSEAPGGLTSLTSLTVEYDVSVLDSVRYAAGALLVEVARRRGEHLGIVLGADGSRVVVGSIVPASVADRMASSLANKTLLDAHQLLKQHTSSSEAPGGLTSLTSLTVEYDVSVLDSVRYAAGALLVEVARRRGEHLGIVLGADGSRVVVGSIVPASVADRCGALHVGDQILAVDDTYIEGSSATPEEVTWLLQNYDISQGCTRLQIMPYHALANGSGSNDWLPRSIGPPSSPSISNFSTISRRPRSRPRYRNSKFSDSETILPGHLGVGGAGRGLCHVETRTVALHAVEDVGYGLHVAADGDGDRQANIVVTAVEEESPAYRCGCLQIGDRLISLNGQCSLTLQEVRALLDLGCSNPTSRLILQTEFDVVDTVVPTSGVFTVRIAKSGPDLGITITASKTIPNDPFIISDIRRGSAAHRTGTLHVGDHVLAIDNCPLDQLSLDDAFNGVQNSQSDIVTLRIQKIDESLRQPQIPEPPEEIVYTVELNRRGGPLGITVSGSEDRTEPIVLSALTQGGLAEKTGALHVGDRILAINDENLEQRPLSDAIRLLQTSGDKVQIKIARQVKNSSEENQLLQDQRGNYSSPGLASIDSAVESWDSGVLETPGDLPQESIKHLDPSVMSFSSFTQHLEPTIIQRDFQQTDSLNQHPEEMTTFGTNNNNNKKHHESQLLFYSDVEDSLCPSPLPLPNYNFTNTLPKYDSSYFFCSKPSLSSRNEYKFRQDVDTYSESTVPDVEIHYVTLHKDSVYDDYGFSVSDGLYEKGVYINRIRRGGPAHLAGVLRPYDRILQVNDTKTKDFDCCLTVPLIASAGDKIELVIARNPYIGCPDEKDMHVLSWTPDDQDLPRISSKSFSSSQNTITKTL